MYHMYMGHGYVINALDPERFYQNFQSVISKLILVIDGCGIYEIALRWLSQDLTNEKASLVQGIVWCHVRTISEETPQPPLKLALKSFIKNFLQISQGSMS